MFDAPVENFALRVEATPFAVPAEHLLPHGMTLAEAVAFADVDSDLAVVFIDGNEIEREFWARVRPKANAGVLVRGVPGIPAVASLLSTVVGTVASSAAAAFGITGGITIAGATISYASVLGLGATYAAQALATSLFSAGSGASQQAQGGQFNQADTAQRFGITGTRNALEPYAAVPVVLGTHRFVPPYGASPYTEIVGNDQYLRLLVVWGYAPVDVSDIRIGNTAIGEFSDVEIEHDLDGTSDNLTLYPAVASQENLSIALTTSYQSRTTPIDTEEIGVTVTFPSGLYRLDTSGVRQSYSVILQGEYRPEGGDWVTFFSETVTRSENSAVRKSWRVAGLSAGTYEVRILRSTESSDSRIADYCAWTALRAFKGEDPVSMPGVAKSAFRIKASDQLNGVADQINAVVSLKIPTWDGSSWAGESATRNPAAIYRFVLRGAANARALSDNRVHDANLGDWYEHCEARGYEYSRPITGRVAIRDIMAEVAATGFASPRMIDDKWGVSIDREKATVVQHFTPRNTMSFSSEVVFPVQPHALRVQFVNRDRDYLEDERLVFDDGFDASTATEYDLLNLPGTTDGDNAFRQGRHFLASGRLRPEIFNLTCDIENLVCERGDLVRLTHDVALIGQASGRIKAIDGSVMTLDELVTFEDGKSYTIRVRKSDGASVSQAATAASGTTTQVTVVSTAGLAVGDLFMFGEAGQESLLALVKAITPADDLQASITCIPYNAAVYSAADEIPDYVSNISAPVSLSPVGPAAPVISNILSDESALPQNFEGAPQPAIFFNVDPGASDAQNARVTRAVTHLIRWKKVGSEDGYETQSVSAFTRVIRINGVEARTAYEIGVQSIDANGGVSPWTAIASHTVAGFVALPPAVDTFRMSTNGAQAYVEWTYPSIAVDVVGYEIRYHPDPDVAAWAYMTSLSEQIPRAARSFTIPSRRGTYAIKAVDAAGNRSEAAVFINSTVTDAQQTNTVVTTTEDPSFAGTRTNVSLVDGRIQLAADTVLADWQSLSDVDVMSAPAQGDGFVLEGSYDFGEVDLGAIFTTHADASIDLRSVGFVENMASWLTLSSVASLAGEETGDGYSAEVQVAWSSVDSETPSYGAWQKFASVDLTARHVKFRVVLETGDSRVSPAINKLSVDLTMPNRVERGEDLVSGAGARSVSIAPAFYSLQSVTLAAQDMQSGDYFQITNKVAGGFDVTFYNSSDAQVSRTFDWQAVGYGQEAA